MSIADMIELALHDAAKQHVPAVPGNSHATTQARQVFVRSCVKHIVRGLTDEAIDHVLAFNKEKEA